MAAKATIGTLLFIALIAFHANTAVASTAVAAFVNPLSVPSCANLAGTNPTKCYNDYKAAYAGNVKSTAGLNNGAGAIGLACNAVNAAQLGCDLAYGVFKSMSSTFGMPFVVCQQNISIAINYLKAASFTMGSKTNLSTSEVIKVQKSCQVAYTHVLQCALTGNPFAQAQVAQPVQLCNIAIHFSKMLNWGNR